MSKDLCELIKGVDDILDVKWVGSTLSISDNPTLNSYCPISNDGNNQKCNTYEETISSAFLTLLVNFPTSNAVGNLESDQLAQYAILWLCYKLNQKRENTISNLNYFHNKYIKDFEKYFEGKPNLGAYNFYRNIIDKKQDSMPIGIKEMSKLYEALKILCKLYTEYNEKPQNCTKCLEEAKNFAEKYNDLNNDYNHIEGSSYNQILFTLSNDYNKLKGKCDSGQSKKFPSLPPINPTKSSAHTYGQTDIQFSDVETSNSSIESKLIPGLLGFSIPIFLGIAYKYSLFVFGKQLHGQYLRGKIKKIKKKMNINI
ncbi:Plasmodium variant antigen protein Cir/Yir/Bir, putative [Plasmodium chabaudi adami]|uniref:Plasmodium variant antigen protein Cir/Yir/Bir, putative n=1 Tax=Plasmodium chabaudi adami TaxID=5826 RepID=A0A1C6X0D9_PLACE|nr:Plasmodium variant antigen protein Cir/Yir/Bir, putative [Plasmodium chabaudi adami]